MAKPIFAVGEFWYSERRLYRIDAVTPDGNFVVRCTPWDHSQVHGKQVQYSGSPNYGWGRESFKRRDDFMTAVYKRRRHD